MKIIANRQLRGDYGTLAPEEVADLHPNVAEGLLKRGLIRAEKNKALIPPENDAVTPPENKVCVPQENKMAEPLRTKASPNRGKAK